MNTRYLLLCVLLLTGCSQGDWRSASRASSGLAPDAASTPEAVLQVYGASAYGWRGWFAIHTWIAAKPANAEHYTVYEVIGWRERRGLPVLRIEAQARPDRYWFGAKPELLLDRRGDDVEALIAAVDQAARDYPWKHEYRVFPGPNSNTFPAWVAQKVPDLGLELPFRAIGSGWAD
ncbi:DUF3750 domain-containing protein [Marinobacterium rhizophilum]|uniref:DUF3750 domain-containing protein n=1 Tax=Marinobacterium rhizophilum TaxID=420402 RepID=A0ABY5HIU3_9GAMM|nr:DUF3750 domain-containing protein [Marinobacterium rhizophilum]UTW11523.1 DUF3750 domain-containing protein [Marinobacterium rhizophilum]